MVDGAESGANDVAREKSNRREGVECINVSRTREVSVENSETGMTTMRSMLNAGGGEQKRR